MSQMQVKATEKGKVVHEGKLGNNRMVVVYKETISGLSAETGYIFAYGKLVRAMYSIVESHTNKTDYLSDFDQLSKALTEKYGLPANEHTYWTNNLYRDDPAEWGMAVAIGHMAKFTTWETERTTISLMLRGDNYNINLNVEYSSKEYKELETKAKKEEEKGKL